MHFYHSADWYKIGTTSCFLKMTTSADLDLIWDNNPFTMSLHSFFARRPWIKGALKEAKEKVCNPYNPSGWEADHITRCGDYPITLAAPFTRFRQDWPGHYIHLRGHSFFHQCITDKDWKRKHHNDRSLEIKYLYLPSAHQFVLPCSYWWDHEPCLLLGNICDFLKGPHLLNTSSPSLKPLCAKRNFSNISSSPSSTLRRFLKPSEGLRKATGIAAARTP